MGLRDTALFWPPARVSLDRGRGHYVAGEDAYGAWAPVGPEVCPIDLVSSYHSGAVSAASLSDDSSRAGSGGYLVYPSTKPLSAWAHSSAWKPAIAARRNSSDRLTSVRCASLSSLATRSSSSWTNTSRLVIDHMVGRERGKSVVSFPPPGRNGRWYPNRAFQRASSKFQGRALHRLPCKTPHFLPPSSSRPTNRGSHRDRSSAGFGQG